MNHAIESVRNQTESPIRRFARDQRGAGLVEYIMLAGLIAIACIFAFGEFSDKIQGAVEDQGKEVQKLGETAK